MQKKNFKDSLENRSDNLLRFRGNSFLEFHELFIPLSQFGNCFVAIYIHAYTVNAMLCHQKIRKEHP